MEVMIVILRKIQSIDIVFTDSGKTSLRARLSAPAAMPVMIPIRRGRKDEFSCQVTNGIVRSQISFAGIVFILNMVIIL